MHVSVLVATVPVGNACLGPHAPRDGFVDNNPENYTGSFSFSFYFSRFALFLIGSIRARFGKAMNFSNCVLDRLRQCYSASGDPIVNTRYRNTDHCFLYQRRHSVRNTKPVLRAGARGGKYRLLHVRGSPIQIFCNMKISWIS